MYKHNYKGLRYDKSVEQFLKDYRFRYAIYGKFKSWKTKDGKRIPIYKLNKRHLENIIGRFGSTKIRKEHPFVWYKFLKEVEE